MSQYPDELSRRRIALELRRRIDWAIAVSARHSARDAEPVLAELEQLSAEAGESWLDPRYVLGEECVTLLTNRWEAGWQPADLVHYLRRGSPRVDDLGVALIREQLRRTGLAAKAPEDWQRQLDGLDDAPAPGPSRNGWLFPADKPLRQLRRALLLMDRLRRMHPITELSEPPSRWTGAPPRPRPAPGPTPDQSLLERVRALLAKAESTEFDAEAEALTAKAQELITRHAIDEALLEADQHRSGGGYQVLARRVHIDNPHGTAKANLIHSVAEANRVRAVWDETAGAATIVGLAGDLERVELLFTSLLVQATRAMLDGDHQARGPSARSTTSYRRSFLLAYAVRIGERLSETTERVTQEYSTDLVPLLAEQREAVEAETDRLFPNIRSSRARAVDGHGWRAGTAAADDAVFPQGRLAGGAD